MEDGIGPACKDWPYLGFGAFTQTPRGEYALTIIAAPIDSYTERRR